MEPENTKTLELNKRFKQLSREPRRSIRVVNQVEDDSSTG